MWNRADRKKISGDDVEKVRTKVEKRLDENFFHARLERLTAGEKDFLHGMAECGDCIRMADVSRALHCNVASLSKRRASLLAKVRDMESWHSLCRCLDVLCFVRDTDLAVVERSGTQVSIMAVRTCACDVYAPLEGR